MRNNAFAKGHLPHWVELALPIDSLVENTRQIAALSRPWRGTQLHVLCYYYVHGYDRSLFLQRCHISIL